MNVTDDIDYANPKVWGPHFWFMMYSIANTYPENPSRDDKKHAYNFYHELRYVLPCKICRSHYSETLKLFSIRKYLDNKDDLVEWVDKINKYINEHKDQDIRKISREDKHKEPKHREDKHKEDKHKEDKHREGKDNKSGRKKEKDDEKKRDKKDKSKKDNDNVEYKKMIKKSGFNTKFRRTYKCKACGR